MFELQWDFNWEWVFLKLSGFMCVSSFDILNINLKEIKNNVFVKPSVCFNSSFTEITPGP